jgi:hypothetical protein
MRPRLGPGLPFNPKPIHNPDDISPLRIKFKGAVYHVTSRGDRREPIYRDDVDRQAQLNVIAQAMERFDAQVLAYCQMGNHYHLVLHTRQANLSRLMRHERCFRVPTASQTRMTVGDGGGSTADRRSSQ